MLHIDRCFAGPVNIDVSEGAFTRSSSAESDWGAGGKRGSGGYLGSMSASMLRSRSQSLLPITNQPLTKSPGSSFSVRRSHRRSTWFKPALALLVLCALTGATYIYTRPTPTLPGTLPSGGAAGAVHDLSEAEHRRRGSVVEDSHLSSYHHHQTVMAEDKLHHPDSPADHRQLSQQQQVQQAAAKIESLGAKMSQQQGAAGQQQQHEQAAAEVDPAAALDHAELGAEEAQQQALEELQEIHQQMGGTQGDAAALGAAHEQQQQQDAAAAALAAAAAAQQQQQEAGAHQEVESAQEAQQAEQAHLAEQAAAHQAALEAARQAALAAQHAAALEQQQAAHDQAVLEAQHAVHAAQQAQQQHVAAEQHVQQHLEVPPPRMPSLYDSSLSALDIHGNEVRMADLHGRAAIILNVASHCGYTQTNYVQLQQIYERYQMYGLEILAFPCNQFGAQEPGTPEEILQFVESNFHVRFPLMGKVDVNGEHAHPIFQFLKLHTPPLPGHPANEDISWNFNKFLLDKWGHPVKRYGPDLVQYELETDVYNELIKVYGNEQHLQH